VKNPIPRGLAVRGFKLSQRIAGRHFSAHRTAASLALLTVFLPAAPAAQAQQGKDPRAGYVFPAGGKSGTTIEVVVGGQFLEGAKEILVSGNGVKVTALRYRKPLSQKRVNEFRDYIQEERKKRAEARAAAAASPNASPVAPATPAAAPKHRLDTPEGISELLKETGATDEEIVNFLQMRDERKNAKRQQNRQLSETVTLKVEIDGSAEAGPRSLRLVTAAAVSNPIVFCVGNLPERSEPAGKKREAASVIKLPAVLNGQILPGETDNYSFELQRGQRIVVAMQARDLIPYLADAVPGWFQPTVILSDSKHREVASTGIFRTGPDPVFSFEAPEKGIYFLEVRDALYRGREDFIYRMSVGEIPFVTGIFPLGGRVGTPVTIDVGGWNLRRVRWVPAPTAERGLHPVPGLSNGFATGDVAFAVDDLPEVAEHEPNNNQGEAQRVTLPVIINGRIAVPGDVDVFEFSCRAREKVVAEVTARRLNSPLDSWLKITDAHGHQIAFNDEFDDKEAGLLTNQADSRLEFTAPEAGQYFAQIGDSRKLGGPDFAYRLRLSGPRPDFVLRFVPSAINGRPGAVVPVALYAIRRDGFNGAIDVAFKDPPEGFLLQGAQIPADTDSVRATLTLPKVPTDAPVKLALEGRATIDGKETIRPAVPADDMLQAFIYHHLVPAADLLAMVSGTKTGSIPAVVSGTARIPVGGTGQVVVSRAKRPPFTIEDARLELRDPPEGITIEGVSRTEDGAAISFRCDGKTKPGTRGNLIVEAFNEKSFPAKDDKKAGKNRWSMGLLPAIPFEITEP